MSRMYTVVFEGVAVTAAQDLFEVTAPATAAVIIHSVHITQDDIETSEQLPVVIKRIPATITSGSGGSSATPRKCTPGDAAAGTTVETCNTTPASSSGTVEKIRRIAENVLNGWHFLFTPEERITIPPSGCVVVALAANPSGSMNFSGEIVFEEVG